MRRWLASHRDETSASRRWPQGQPEADTTGSGGCGSVITWMTSARFCERRRREAGLGYLGGRCRLIGLPIEGRQQWCRAFDRIAMLRFRPAAPRTPELAVLVIDLPTDRRGADQAPAGALITWSFGYTERGIRSQRTAMNTGYHFR